MFLSCHHSIYHVGFLHILYAFGRVFVVCALYIRKQGKILFREFKATSMAHVPLKIKIFIEQNQDFCVAASQRSFTFKDRAAETPWSGQWPLPPLPRPGNGNAHFVLVRSSTGTLVLCS